ncbi:aminotransferase class V-fold PLP-dependent enzyme [Desulfoluna spongiiphila]|uniref:aminotransferase class V-fold PLP-dependent enzyme n=1 Tax=Desulfoluna spongiiphila TaxID=419481 RepID=UPI001258C48A|nr:aminotransferase class V-fold PLP-dependent enzyme [Desulfoluna spongiiphila]VVS93552.1 pyridoxal phosphate-dependent transferase [Desulfoluna spongiiphila]
MEEQVSAEKSDGMKQEWVNLIRVFTCPEDEKTRDVLVHHMRQILFELHDFLIQNVGITEAVSLKEIADRCTDTVMNSLPEKRLADVVSGVFEEIAPHAVNVASPYFVGHMTAAIPYFMVHLKAIVAALNQNVVKLETSKMLSVVEKQVVAKVHRIIYQKDEAFYREHVQNTHTSLGSFTEGGTTANLTALWVARNRALGPVGAFEGVEVEGLPAAYAAHNIDRCVILVSRRCHYSLRKCGGILGIGNGNIIPVPVDSTNRMRVDRLAEMIEGFKKEGRTRVAAVVTVAGTTETGNVDPIPEISALCRKEGIYLHADAAWGGPTLMSETYAHLLKGIEQVDSVTIDGHKQFYMPMSTGMVFFKDPTSLDAVAYHANYIIRKGSVDLGSKTLSGSREANCLILDSAFKIMGSRGYGMLIDHGIELARSFAEEIERRGIFQLVTRPELNILTYRVCPAPFQEEMAQASPERILELNEHFNEVNRALQQEQREAGNSFVSRTVLELETVFPGFPEGKVVVLRSVLMNPLTTMDVLRDILDEQEALYADWLRGTSTRKGRNREDAI